MLESPAHGLEDFDNPTPGGYFNGGGDGVKLGCVADFLLADEVARAVFIDDAPYIFLKGSKRLLTTEQVAVLRARCHIVVYGRMAATVAQYGTFLHLVPLPSWEALDTLYENGV